MERLKLTLQHLLSGDLLDADIKTWCYVSDPFGPFRWKPWMTRNPDIIFHFRKAYVEPKGLELLSVTLLARHLCLSTPETSSRPQGSFNFTNSTHIATAALIQRNGFTSLPRNTHVIYGLEFQRLLAILNVEAIETIPVIPQIIVLECASDSSKFKTRIES